jgi:hypothetical protein
MILDTLELRPHTNTFRVLEFLQHRMVRSIEFHKGCKDMSLSFFRHYILIFRFILEYFPIFAPGWPKKLKTYFIETTNLCRKKVAMVEEYVTTVE